MLPLKNWKNTIIVVPIGIFCRGRAAWEEIVAFPKLVIVGLLYIEYIPSEL